MSLVNDIKNQVKKSGSNKSKFLYFRSGTKVRVRFLSDMEDGFKFTFHDSFDKGINVPCQELFGRDCPHCDDEDLRTRDQYCWPVWDYDAKEVKLLMAPVNNCSPIPALVAMYDTYGTLTDRDYVITKQGQQQTTTFSVVPMDKVKFRNEKAKALSESKVLALLDKAFPCEDAEDDDDDMPKRKKKAPKKQAKKSRDWEDDEGDDNEEPSYEDMSAKELYQLCKEIDPDVAPKKPKSYYIDILEAANEEPEDNDWDEDEDEEEDEWDD